ncbi:hypothetical protein PRZ48_014415 [Zasmidium cellare]|uniref:Myb-like domain-containing protein n=1 Tax=Zasmidium cellare TaxID=395010 RepID=A0ABR0DY86_ZASCE|nr:hypothetical protein PRZ48_014415 [Zasmidium cellare]
MALNLTAREQELLCAVIDVMKADIDWKAVAPKANFNTPKQARDKWIGVRAKITAGLTGGKSPAKAMPKKRKNSDDDTPSKSKKTKKDSPLADEDDEESKGLIKPEEESEGEMV